MFYLNKYQEEKEYAIYIDTINKKEKRFRVQRLTNSTITQNNLIDNMYLSEETINLTTHARLDFKINNKVIYRNKIYLIKDIQEEQEQIELDTSLLFKPKYNVKYILNLIKGE